MVTIHSKTLIAAGAITVAAALLAILLPAVMLPLLPDLRPLVTQLLIRLQEVAAFLAFTTAIAVGILSTQRRNKHHDNSKKLFLEHHSLGFIFGDEEIDPFHVDNSKHACSPLAEKVQLSNGIVHGDFVNDSLDLRSSSANMDDVHPQSIWSCETSMQASHLERLRATGEESGSVGDYHVQRMLHRKSSSLDDSVNYVAEIEAPPKAGITDLVRAADNEYGAFASKKSTKRVSFSLASSPSSSEHVANDANIRQSRRESSAKERDMSANSPGDITGQADAFIARFKEQLRMQKLESIPKFYRKEVVHSKV
ncbi:hypothetical protein L7F22_046803 [Adiantum nelumboides]|nr:hypothetical protein [Adiantum nelumboides]